MTDCNVDTTGSIYYIGLDNRNDENCVNEGCNGKLFLMDNTPFTYNTSFMTSNVTAESGYFTFKVISNAHLLGSTTSVSRFSVCVLDCGLSMTQAYLSILTLHMLTLLQLLMVVGVHGVVGQVA